MSTGIRYTAMWVSVCSSLCMCVQVWECEGVASVAGGAGVSACLCMCVAGFCICVCVGECVQVCPSYFQIGNLFGSRSQTCNFVMYGSLFVDKSTICKNKCRGMRVSLKNNRMIHMFDHVCNFSVKNLLGPAAATITQTNHRQISSKTPDLKL